MTEKRDVTALKLRKARCAVLGHRWDWRSRPDIDVCLRCGVTSDEPSVRVWDRRRIAFKTWSPFWLSVRKTGASLRLGWAYKPINACLMLTAHWGWDRTAELPGVGVNLDLWRLKLGAGLGHGWMDEDADDRGFFWITARVTTYGLRYIGCWLGHKPETSRYMPNHVYCERCEEPLKGEPESIEVEA